MTTPTDPTEAGEPRTKGPTRTYEAERIRVLWDASRCIHSANCLSALPEVFDTRRRPWVDVTAAGAEEIAAAVRTCPTGALRYEGVGGFPNEVPESPTVVAVRPNGPLFVRGRVEVRDARGRVLAEEHRLALCRCGASGNKPFCDNSHRRIRFRDDAPPP
jgi:uncharacterized Fe-S cluster protein YjdI/CDGSH-type Zn-finger protein